MISRLHLAFVLLFFSVGASLFAQGSAMMEPPVKDKVEPLLATTPVPRSDDWWQVRHANKLAEKAAALEGGKAIDIIFVGDSITHSWERAGKKLWAERYAPLGAFNIGYSGDRTEHVLWRLGQGDAGEENNEIAGLSPKLFVVMIGTNNTGHRQDKPEETAAGVEAIVDRLLELSPESQVLLLAIFPRDESPKGELRQINNKINQLISPLGDNDQVTYLDVAEVFLDENGFLPEKIMPDFLHPQKKGYRLWADAMQPAVDRLMTN